jgi:hypothetical protein
LKKEETMLKEREEIKKSLEKIADPSKSIDDAERDQFAQLKEKLAEEKAKGDAKAEVLLRAIDQNAAIPTENKVQPVSEEEYEEIKKLWEENYRTLPVPAEFGTEATGRVAWIESDLKVVEETSNLLNASEADKQKEGMQKVSEILPMLMLGGFSQSEIVGYLKAKTEAGRNVVTELQKDEEGKETVGVATNASQDENAAKAEQSADEEKKSE